MRDVFNDFDWPVAPNYEWQDCLTQTGRRVVASGRDLARLSLPPDRGATAQHIWRQRDEAHARRARETGPVLRPVRPDQARDDYPLRQHPVLFQEFAAIDYTNTTAILAFAKAHGALGVPFKKPRPSVAMKHP